MKDKFQSLKNDKPTLFSPNVIRNITFGNNNSITLNAVNANLMADTNIDSTSSYKYGIAGDGLKSTQQLNIDWSKFEEHTFFNSAQVKTNVSFDKIFNQYPFDGTKKELEAFFDGLTGFEKYVYDNLPKYKGYAFFSGSNGAETNAGTWIEVKDMQGAQYPDISRDSTGYSILNPGLSSMTLEMQLFVPSQSNTNQIVIQKLSQSLVGYDGYSLALSNSSSPNSGTLTFYISSGSKNKNISFNFSKGSFHHLALIWDRTPSVNKLFAYVDSQMVASSSGFEMSETYWQASNLYVGSGSSYVAGGTTFTPQNTLSGAIDELRIWHEVRSLDNINEYQHKSVFATDNLKLYYKFNEPPHAQSLVTIDSSGKSLHGKLNILGNALGVREVATGSIAGASPMTYEKLDYCPILFSQITDVENYRQDLLVSASNFDSQNPSLITKLIPKHYLYEGQVYDALSTEEGPILTDLDSTNELRSSKLGGTQVLLSMLYVWAKYFDELKLFTEAFGNLNYADYESSNTIPDQFLQFLASQNGFTLPPLFNGSSIDQFIESENIQDTISTNDLSLQYVQNQIWRRILINIQDVIKSKGTLHSVKSFIRTLGIDPDSNFRIREYGGPNRTQLSWARESKSDIASMIDFVSGGLITSLPLSSSRVEPGYPYYQTTASAGLWTSASFTYEGLYRLNTYHASQSLIRVQHSSSVAASSSLLFNIVAAQSGSTTLYIKPNIYTTSTVPLLKLQISGANLYDGDLWYVSFGRSRNDDISGSITNVSSSYYFRLAKQINGDIYEYYQTSSYYLEDPYSQTYLQNVVNTSDYGNYLQIGSASINTVAATGLSDLSIVEDSRYTDFHGKVSGIRFWSKFLTDQEWKEHARNYKSVGVQNPLNNFNFNTKTSGSWQRLRIDASCVQDVTQSSNTGTLQIFDYTQNNQHLSGTLFQATSSIIVPQRIYYSYISPKFDEATTNNKVRSRGYQEYENVVSNSYASFSPVYELEQSETPTDKTLFSIDFSVVDALNQDIVNIFSTLDSLDNIIGNPELLYSPDYPQLESLRDVYFNRLTDKINFKLFFEFYKWFDSNIGVFISQLIPRKTKFLGVNYVIESHMLERPKMEYNLSDIYLGDDNRHGLKDTILLQLVNGNFSRY